MAENSQTKSITPRQALISAALCGWKGDEPSTWISPVVAEDILGWAKSYLPGPNKFLASAFENLVTEGLFFEIHHGVFDPPCYYCSFVADFLKEIPTGPDFIDFWEDIVDKYNKEYGLSIWHRLGVCAGQGSQGPSGEGWGSCLGASCCSFLDGSEHCTHDLNFVRGLKVLKKKCL